MASNETQLNKAEYTMKRALQFHLHNASIITCHFLKKIWKRSSIEKNFLYLLVSTSMLAHLENARTNHLCEAIHSLICLHFLGRVPAYHKKKKKNCRFIYLMVYLDNQLYTCYTLSLVYIHSYQQIQENKELFWLFLLFNITWIICMRLVLLYFFYVDV